MKITSKEMLLKHIEDHKGKNVPLFTAFRTSPNRFVKNDTIHADAKIEIKYTYYDGERSSHEMLHVNGHFKDSLHDRHISGTEQNYNDNWWFTTREEAEEYISEKENKS